MSPIDISRKRATRRPLAAIAVPLLAAVALAACGSGSKSSTTTSSSGTSTSSTANATVKTGTVKGATVLVDSSGMTLYHLTAETGGKFICTGSCAQIWHPVTASGKPTGSVGSLSTVKRPDGTTQVTYKGMPLYTFTKDTAAGQANGQGFKDVGTWTYITVSGSKPAPAPTTTTNSGGGGYGY